MKPIQRLKECLITITYYKSINGKFYSTDEYSFDDIKAQLEALIHNHNENREIDFELNSNLVKLEAIINASYNKKGVIGELANYRSLYPGKSPTTLSGEFYGEFVVAFAEMVQIVQSQIELNTKLLYDSLVIDDRFNIDLGGYQEPNPSGTKLGYHITEPNMGINGCGCY